MDLCEFLERLEELFPLPDENPAEEQILHAIVEAEASWDPLWDL